MAISAVSRPRRGGPPPMVPALAFAALVIASVAVSAGGPLPDTGGAAALGYARTHTGQLHAAGFLAFAAALPLAVWTATVCQRLRNLGTAGPGPVMGLAGGVLASASLALSGLLAWTLGEAAPALDPAAARTVIDLGFTAGAAGFTVPLALLIAGIAVPALILHLVSRPLAVIGLLIAAVGMLSTFSLLTPALDPTLPVTRFGALVWIVAVSIVLAGMPSRAEEQLEPHLPAHRGGRGQGGGHPADPALGAPGALADFPPGASSA